MADPVLPRRPLALVTGGQSGIGESIAKALAVAGHELVIADLHTDVSGQAYAAQWGVTTRVECLAADISEVEQVDDLFFRVSSQFGRPPGVLINNAAMQIWAPLIDLALSDWEKTLKVNLTGTFLMTQCFARHRRDVGGGGVIINLGSGCNKLAFPGLISYVASKGGIEMFTKAAALELGDLGIRVNCIAPGAIETERTRAETDTYADSWAPLTPLGRVGTVEDVADAVLALTGDSLRFVSGQTLSVDGGLFSRAIWPPEY